MARWYQDMIDLFEENGIAYANWNYKSGSFGLIDGEKVTGEGKFYKNYVGEIV